MPLACCPSCEQICEPRELPPSKPGRNISGGAASQLSLLTPRPRDFINQFGFVVSASWGRMLFVHALATALVLPAPRLGQPSQLSVAPAPRFGPPSLKSESAVVDALGKLFKAFDSNGDGFVTLSTMLLADQSSMRTGGEWESRQARVGLGVEWR